MAAPSPIDELARYLAAQAPGPLEVAPLVRVLAPAWDALAGPAEESTYWDKLGRMVDPQWEPPVLRFTLERHPGTKTGSSRDPVHFWEVDIERRTARIARRSYHQNRTMDARLDVKALIDELMSIIEAGVDDPRLVWTEGRSVVRLIIGQTIPATNKQTTAERRSRFREALRHGQRRTAG